MAIETNIEAEARRLVAAIDERRIPARLIGGMAIRLRLGSELAAVFERPIGDLDFIVASGAQRDVGAFFEQAGYEGNMQFNAINGSHRMLFHDEANQRQIDVFVGSFEMCHSLPLAERLEVEPRTLPNAELLLTKLQIVELNVKDRNDAVALLAQFPIRSADGEAINGELIGSLCARDWGLWRTVTMNLDRLEQELPDVALEDATAAAVRARVGELRGAIEATPKTGKWKWRAKVGDRKRWYELPEEVG